VSIPFLSIRLSFLILCVFSWNGSIAPLRPPSPPATKNLRQSLLSGDQTSNLLLRVGGQARIVSPEITSIVGVLCNVVGDGVRGDKGLGLTARVVSGV